MYHFKVIFEPYDRKSPFLEDVRALVVSGITLASKSLKVGGIEINKKFVHYVDGRFTHVAGSNRYPILFPKRTRVVLWVHNFPDPPKLEIPMIEHKPFLKIEM